MNSLKQVKEHFTNFIKNCKRFLTIKSILTLLAAPGLVQGYQILSYILEKQIREEKSAKITQLSTYADFGKIIGIYQKDISPDLAKIKDPEGRYMKILKNGDSFCDSLLNKPDKTGPKTGAKIFEEYREYQNVHNFYEMLGLLIHYDVVDFDLVFSLFVFPGEFIGGEYSKDPSKNPLIALDSCVGKNWFGRTKNDELIDYGAFVKELGYNYNYSRMKLKQDQLSFKSKLDQEEKVELATLQMQIKKLEDNQCKPFYPFDPQKSNTIYWNKLYSKKYGLFQEINRFIQGTNRRC